VTDSPGWGCAAISTLAGSFSSASGSSTVSSEPIHFLSLEELPSKHLAVDCSLTPRQKERRYETARIARKFNRRFAGQQVKPTYYG
jgi:hypothetical protein